VARREQNTKDSHKSGKFEVRTISFPSLMEVLSKNIITRWILPYLPARPGGRRCAVDPIEVVGPSAISSKPAASGAGYR